MRSALSPVVVVLAVACMPSLASAQVAADRMALMEGVPAITAPGALPGSLAVFGDDAFVVVTGRQGQARLPMVAATRYGKGRIVAFGHEGFVTQARRDKNNERFVENCLTWAGKGKPSPQTLRIGTFEPELLSALHTREGDAVLLKAEDRKDIATRLRNLDVLYLNQAALDGNPPAIAAVRDWIKNEGGGVVVAGPGWGWQMVTGKRLATDQSATLLCRDAGIVWTEGTLETTGSKGAYIVNYVGVLTGTSDIALDQLTAFAEGKMTLSPGDMAQATQVISEAMSALPPASVGFAKGEAFASRVESLCSRFAGNAIPTKATPFTVAMPFARLSAVLEKKQAQTAVRDWGALCKVPANPAAADFPGAVPDDAPVQDATLKIVTSVPGWHSTGLYARPGGRGAIQVTVPAEAIGQGLAVRIGAHTDTLWHLDKWERYPEISERVPLSSVNTDCVNAFGGPVYIEVPENCKLGTIPVTIRSGAVAAPLFVRGKTTLEEWKTVRTAPAPWAELVGKRVALTVPSSVVRTLDDPEALMAYWDQVMDTCADFYGVPKERRKQQRYCVDRQISAGYMHSGYPIMTWEDVAKTFVDLSVLRGKDGLKVWGFYHELGHNHQKPEWTWEGCGEVTNNLFSLYGGEVFNGVDKTYVTSHPAVQPAERQKRLQKYLADGASYAQWQSDPFLALTMFIELRQKFGWEPFTKLFAEYEGLPDKERPKSEEAKRDRFMVRFSQIVGANLGPFFVRWGLPTSEKARQQIQNLPARMSDELGK